MAKKGLMPKVCPVCGTYMILDGTTQEAEGKVEHYYCFRCKKIYDKLVEDAVSYIIDELEEKFQQGQKGKKDKP